MGDGLDPPLRVNLAGYLDRAPEDLSVRERTTEEQVREVREILCWWSMSGAAWNET